MEVRMRTPSPRTDKRLLSHRPVDCSMFEEMRMKHFRMFRIDAEALACLRLNGAGGDTGGGG